MLRNKKVLVTGGTGFIGSHIVDEMVDRNCNVTVLGCHSRYDVTNIAASMERAGDSLNIVRGTITDKLDVDRCVAGTDVIFHEAAYASSESMQHPIETFEVNTKGTLRVLESMKEYAKNAVLVFASTGTVYGEPIYIPQNEEHPCNPATPHGISKLAAEHCIRFYAQRYGLKAVILRYHNVIGTRQTRGALVNFIRRILADEPIIIEGTGDQKLSVTSVADVVMANVLAYEVEAAYGKTFNISGNESVTVNELAALVGCLLKKEPKITHSAERIGDVHGLEPDITLAKNLLQYYPNGRLSTVIHDMIAEEKKRQQ